MVKIEEVSSSSAPNDVADAIITEDVVNEDVYEDDFDINESFTDRIVALKDVIPPQYRYNISSSLSGLVSGVKSTAKLGGKYMWIISSSTLLLGVPLSLCILSEQQLVEMEKGMGITESNNVLSGGIEQGFAEAPRA